MCVVAVTGCSGYIGQRLLLYLDSDDHVSRIIGFDKKHPSVSCQKLDFYCRDIRDQEIISLIEREGAQKIVHLAFIVDALHDKRLMHDINITGTRNILAAAAKCKVRQLVIASSTSVFNSPTHIPQWNREDDLPYPHPSLDYISDKGELESLTRLFKRDHPEIVVSVVRPSIVCGPNVNNYISRYFMRMPVIMAVGRCRPQLQFVHEDDVAEVFAKVVQKEAEGFFHAVGEGTVGLDAVAGIFGKPIVGLPSWFIYPLVDLLWKIHFPLIEGPSGALDGIRYPFIVSDKETRSILGLGPRRPASEVVHLMKGSNQA
jgi:UDP-glucose 4-epimerase